MLSVSITALHRLEAQADADALERNLLSRRRFARFRVRRRTLCVCFFTSLGFTIEPALDDIAGDEFYGTISAERLDVLDTDLLIWDQLQYVEGGKAAVEADPLVQKLAAMREQRTVFMEGDLENAFAFNSVLSLPFVLDAVLPMLRSAAS